MPYGSVADPDPHWSVSNWKVESGPASKWLDPDPHQKRDKLDPDQDPHQFADGKPKYMEQESIWTLFHGFEPLFRSLDPDPDPHHPHQDDADPQHLHMVHVCEQDNPDQIENTDYLNLSVNQVCSSRQYKLFFVYFYQARYEDVGNARVCTLWNSRVR